MKRVARLSAAAVTAAAALTSAPQAHSVTGVTYEVVSTDVGAANIEYFDGAQRQSLLNVALPWRITVPVANPNSSGTDVAELRADWRWAAAPNKWVTTRVYFGDVIRCENTLDVGNAACYGTTPFSNS
jgi:hypothetical protein